MGITQEQALACLASDDLIGIGMEADAVRRELHLDAVVTYGMHSSSATAEMIFGLGETVGARVARLQELREQQARTGEFIAFRLVASAALKPEEPTAVEYLKTLAVARLMLDGFANIEASLETQGLKVLQMALRFGANDAGEIPEAEEENVRRVIRGAGFMPVERTADYCSWFMP
jgi:cyclic dehypoxanthinyl futalosine synthase